MLKYLVGAMALFGAVSAPVYGQSIFERGLKVLGSAVRKAPTQSNANNNKSSERLSASVVEFEKSSFIMKLNRQAVEGGWDEEYTILSDDLMMIDIEGDGDQDAALLLTACESDSCHPTTNASVIVIYMNGSNGLVRRSETDLGFTVTFAQSGGPGVDVISSAYGGDDPACCPSELTRHSFRIDEYGDLRHHRTENQSPDVSVAYPNDTRTALSIPYQFHGRWAPTLQQCKDVVMRDDKGRVVDTMPSDTAILVSGDGYEGFETGLTLLGREPSPEGNYTFRAQAGPAEDYYESLVTFRMQGAKMSITNGGYEYIYSRCP